LSNSTKPSTPEVQKSTNLKSELWCFHRGFIMMIVLLRVEV
jgi:hypothetical protein